MNIVLMIFTIFVIVIGDYLLFVVLTINYFYSSAITDLFLFDHKKWKLYQQAKKQGVKHYLRPEDYENDYHNNQVSDFYLYPLIQEDGGIKYYLYTKNCTFITGNFQLTSRL